MAFIDKTMFEVTVSNSVNNQTQNVPGKFGTGTGSEFATADCSAGFLCVRNGLIPSEGYEGVTPAILNGNTWFFNAAVDGNDGLSGDHTGIYAFNNYDVNKAVSGANQWNVGAKTLGLGLPAGNRGDFCEIIIGEQYTFGSGNFSSEGTGVYFKILREKNVNEGTSFWGTGYVLQAARA